ncbi:MAG: hypothetical protein IPN29_10350 [Saprospiraceae bacterium]|nr:hypothetical protein [Saprospiraceae bacterium]
MDQYRIVSCDLYDQLSNAAVMKQPVRLLLINDVEMFGKIDDIFTKEKQEFCVIDHKVIRLDKILAISILQK